MAETVRDTAIEMERVSGMTAPDAPAPRGKQRAPRCLKHNRKLKRVLRLFGLKHSDNGIFWVCDKGCRERER